MYIVNVMHVVNVLKVMHAGHHDPFLDYSGLGFEVCGDSAPVSMCIRMRCPCRMSVWYACVQLVAANMGQAPRHQGSNATSSKASAKGKASFRAASPSATSGTSSAPPQAFLGGFLGHGDSHMNPKD